MDDINIIKRLAENKTVSIVMALLLVTGALGGCSSQDVTKEDKALFLRAQDLVSHGFKIENMGQYEKFNKTGYFDGSVEIEYEFETPENEQEVLYIYQTISFETKTSDALLTQGSEKVGILVGLKSQGVKEESVPNARKYGDSSSLSLLVSDQQPFGNYFTVRKGTRTYLLLTSGIYFEDGDDWDELIAPKLEQLFIAQQ